MRRGEGFRVMGIVGVERAKERGEVNSNEWHISHKFYIKCIVSTNKSLENPLEV